MGVSPKIEPYNLFIIKWLQVLNSLKLLNQYEAIQLFVERAATIESDRGPQGDFDD